MDILSSFTQINWFSVLVAALSAFAIGSVWYSPLLFGATWLKLIGLTEETIDKSNMPFVFGTSFLLNIVGAVVLDLFIGVDANLLSGLSLGLLISIAWIATSLAINYMYGQKPLKLYLIDAGYFVVFFTVEGAILGAW